MAHIVLDLNNSEYSDNYIKSTAEDQSELWQQQAKEQLVELLKRYGLDAKKYKNDYNNSPMKNSYHHAILINGDRGAGKTVFLKNASQIWMKYVGYKEDMPKLFFTKIIDPTLLDIDDMFSEVIVATIFSSVERKINNPSIPQSKKDNFYNSLKKLAMALGKSHDYSDLKGIDRILQYSSGVHVEEYFHDFLFASVDILDCNAIVVTIDDIDMKINGSFEVLDEIRRLLGCPLIIPLVSGDYDLYSHLANMKFEDALVNRLSSNETRFNGENKSRHLSNAYLTKVFPTHSRLPLESVENLLPNLSIKCDEYVISYKKYVENLLMTFYPLCNGQERSTQWASPKNAREVNQLIRMLSPSAIRDKDKTRILWNTFLLWSEEQQDGLGFVNAKSWIQITDSDPNSLSLIDNIAFNPRLQIQENKRWAKKDFYSQQELRMKEIRTNNSRLIESKDMNFSIFNSVYTQGNKTLRSMPALEYIKDPMYLSQKIADAYSNNVLIALYTHHAYYSTQLNRRYHIFFSRAFEVLFWSILSVTGNINHSDNSKHENLSSILNSCFKRVPFYSIFSVNTTKMIEEDVDVAPLEAGGNENNSRNPAQHNEEQTVSSFVSKIIEWSNQNNEALNGFNKINLIPLMSSIFNKIFTQLHTLRENFKAENENLTDLALRFEYIFINALASFIRKGEVVNTNIAITANVDSLRDIKSFIANDKTLSRNLSGLIDPETRKVVVGIDDESKPIACLIEVIWSHPLFAQHSIASFPVGKLTKVDVINIVNKYLESSGQKNVSRQSVYEWAINNEDEAKNILTELQNAAVSDELSKSKIHDSKGHAYRIYYGISDALHEGEKNV